MYTSGRFEIHFKKLENPPKTIHLHPVPQRQYFMSNLHWKDLQNTWGSNWNSKNNSGTSFKEQDTSYKGCWGQEAITRTHLFNDLNVHLYNPPTILLDSQGALTIADNPTEHQWAKHIAIRYHHIRNLLQENQIALGYILRPQQIADIFTKALHFTLHQRFVSVLGFNQ